MYTRATHACVQVTCICLRLHARARRRPCARSTRTDAGRKINIKFTSRLCTHVDREPRRKIRTRRNAEAADIPNRIAIASERDCTRINREYFELVGGKGVT